ncbi:hypothetical protein JOC93_001350 [Priestia taiwanensis]|nr:hypothetical protein [Priestia taiwanensis]
MFIEMRKTAQGIGYWGAEEKRVLFVETGD